MGCYNGTCGFSNLPINRGDEVVFIPLVKQQTKDWQYPDAGVSMYSTLNFRPFMFPVRGTYDDYGGVENIDKEHNEHLDLLQAQLETRCPIYGPTHKDAGKKITDFHCLSRVTICYNGALMRDEDQAIPKVCSGIMVLAEVYDYLTKMCVCQGEKFDKKFEDQMMKVKSRFKIYESGLVDMTKEKTYFESFNYSAFSRGEPSWVGGLNPFPINPDDKDQTEFLKSQLIDFTNLEDAFMILRKGLVHSCSGAGSQCTEFDSHAEFHKFIMELAEKKFEKEQEGYEDWDLDEEEE